MWKYQELSRPFESAARRGLVALFTMNLLNYIDRFILAAVVEPVQTSLGVSQDSVTGLLSTIFFVSYMLFSPLMGWLGDRRQIRRNYLLAFGVGVWSLATFCSGLAGYFRLPAFWGMPGPFWEMVLARAILGIGEATYAVLAPALIGDLFRSNQRNRAMAIFYLAIPVGAGLGYAIGGEIEALFNWRAAFFVVGLPGLAVALAALTLVDPPRGGQEDLNEDQRLRQSEIITSWRDYPSLIRNPSYVYDVLGMAMFTFALGGLQFWMPKFLHSERDMLLKNADRCLGLVVVISGLVGTALGGWLGDHPALQRPGWHFKLCGWPMLASVPFMMVALVASRPPVIFSSMLIGLTLAFINYGPSNAILVNVTVPRVRAMAFAASIFFVHLLGDIPSPYAMGLVSDATGSLFWGLAITIPLVALSGAFFCLGARHLEADQDAVRQQLRVVEIPAG